MISIQGILRELEKKLRGIKTTRLLLISHPHNIHIIQRQLPSRKSRVAKQKCKQGDPKQHCYI